MKKSELQQLKNKPLNELQKSLDEHRKQLQKLKFDLAQGKVKNIRQVQETKRTIAKIMGLIKEKQYE